MVASQGGRRPPAIEILLAIAALALAGPRPAAAQSRAAQSYAANARGPFADFAGAYRGGGLVIGADGQRERISCRANASVAGGGRELTQSIVCASDSYKFDIRGRAIAEGGAVSGQWQETTRGVTGEIAGRVNEGLFSGRVSGGGFNAAFALRNNGRKLTFDLRPEGGDVARVDVGLSR